MTDIDPRALMAARNNADLYATVFAAHGLRFERRAYAFIGIDQPPPYYSDMTIVDAGHHDVIEDIIKDRAGGVGIKDSFCELDASALGLKTLFTASWIYHAGYSDPHLSTWDRVSTPDHLERWEAAWKRAGSSTDQCMFPTTMLGQRDTVFLAAMDGDDVIAGCIANRSADCVGLSNVFAFQPRPNLYGEAAMAVAAHAPGQPIVGYERDNDLKAGLFAGFQITGQLRVLVPNRPSP